MKLMTLNSHSLEEPDYENKLLAFVNAVVREAPEVIALQEVNQLAGEITDSPPVRTDNHAFRAAGLLSQRGLHYHWTWLPCKVGYGRYDEGLALFSRRPILKIHQFYISGTRDYTDWKTRKILGITVDTGQSLQHFFTVHMGWWEDEQEPFARQWQRIEEGLTGLPEGQIWLMGDFNSPAHIPGQGYDLIRSRGWFDTWQLAAHRDSGITVDRAIDGWKQYPSPSGMRIDYIWTNLNIPVQNSQVIFNGKNEPVISDHFGVMAEIKRQTSRNEGADL